MNKLFGIIGALVFICIFHAERTHAQEKLLPLTTLQTRSDTSRLIEIVRANKLRQITLNDSTTLEALTGNAVVKQGNTLLEGDSIVMNKRLGIVEVFGRVHINDADTVNTYAQYVKYIGAEQIAYLKKNVQLSDGRAQLFTDDLEYNLKTGIAVYKGGGRVVNGKTILQSKEAVYYSDTKDIFFKRKVLLDDPKYHMKTDSLRYNTEFKNVYFISPTRIESSNGNIDTRSGSYNLETGEAIFLDKTVFRDSSRFISGNKVAIEEKTGIIQIEGNGKFVDSTNKVIVLGNQLLIDKKNSTFLATRKPVMILYSDKDSTYISADTLFSGKRLKSTAVISDSSIRTSNKKTKSTPAIKQDSIRYFIGFHHVRIYNDSLQAVSDSLHYSTEDSTFKLLQHPICWSNNNQISGDTIHLITENQKAKQLKVFNNALVINRTNEGFYNQIAGRTMNAYFINGNIDYIRTKGSPAESIFYPQDDDSAYVGMNYSKGDLIDIYFTNKELNKIKFVNEVEGTLYPLRQIPEEKKQLKDFIWQQAIRPKNKFEIFE